MEIEFSPKAKNDLEKWKKSGNKIIEQRITSLTKSILESPFEGIGKPEPLKHQMSGLWSRRITAADRLVYELKTDLLIIHSLKGHY